MRTFGILSPTLGLRTDFPSILLEKAYTPEPMKDCVLRYGEIWRTRKRLPQFVDSNGDKVQTPDGFPIIHIHRLVKRATGTEYICVFTKKNIYRWDYGSKAYVHLWGPAADDRDFWDTTTYADQIIATNGADKVLVSDVPSTDSFVVLGDTTNGLEYDTGVYTTTAEYVTTFENYLIIGNITDDGTKYPHRIRWANLGTSDDWMGGDAGAAEIEGVDPVSGFGQFRDQLFIFKQRSIHRMWLVSTAMIFNISAVSQKVGCLAPHSIINTPDGDLVFLASDFTIRSVDKGEISSPISRTLKSIEPERVKYAKADIIERTDEAVFSVQGPLADADVNDDILVYNRQRWAKLKIPVHAFGRYARQEVYQWNTLPEEYDTWLNWGWDTWEYESGLKGFLSVICSDNNGYIYSFDEAETDDGNTYEAHFTLTTDLADKKALPIYKRLLQIQTYFRREASGQATVSVKRDTESGWTTAGTVDLFKPNEVNVTDIPVDFRAKTFHIKVSAESRFRFLGAMFKFIPVGER